MKYSLLSLGATAVLAASMLASVPVQAVTIIIRPPENGDTTQPITEAGIQFPGIVGPGQFFYTFRNTDTRQRQMKDLTIVTTLAENISIDGTSIFNSRNCAVQTACHVVLIPGKTGVGWQQSFRLILSDSVANQTITAFPSYVPEASTWMMAIFGLGLTGAMMRRRRREIGFPLVSG